MSRTRTAIIRTPTPTPGTGSTLAAGRSLVEMFLAGRSPRTLEAYRADLADFARFAGASTAEEAITALLAGGAGQANQVASAYKSHLLDRNLSPATTNRRLAALRSVVKLARVFGLVPFGLEVENVPSQPYRDTRGPGVAVIGAILHELEVTKGDKGRRDAAIIRLLFDLALRRAEVCSLDLADVDLQTSTIKVMGKGRREPITLTLPTETRDALAGWIEVRGDAPGPLFTNLHHNPAVRGSRLTGRSLARIVTDLGLTIGVVGLHPHSLRHASITAALDATNGDVRSVARFSRHKQVSTVMLYDDARSDMFGRIAAMVAARIMR